MNGETCGHDICAICLDPPTEGALALGCRHSFHAECLLASFSGETPGQWKCPCCRALVCTRAEKTRKSSSSSFIKSTGEEVALPGDFESLVLPSNMHYYRIEDSRWGTLQAFLTAAACALAETKHTTSLQQQQQHTCARSRDLQTSSYPQYSLPRHSSFSSIPKKTKRSLVADQCMTFAEKFCPPTASSITAFLGHAQLQRLLDPSLPHPLWRFARYICILSLSIAAICLGVWFIRLLMFVFGVAVCAAADATISLFSIDQMDTMCVPMVPDNWTLPVGFALVGLYITLQISVIAGVTLRHVLLKWDEQAWGAVGLWFVVCLGYTVFVYFARYLLTVVVSSLVPFPSDGLDGNCVPTIENPDCY